jgi:hypothetical protein
MRVNVKRIFACLQINCSLVVEKNGELFMLKRTADLSEPVCEQDLNLAQAEEETPWISWGLGLSSLVIGQHPR